MTTPPPQLPPIHELLRMGREEARRKHVEADKQKIGTLRAGGTGALDDHGNFAGACPRKSYLRSLGIEVEPPPDHTQIMFQGGVASESEIFGDLLAGLENWNGLSTGYIVLREEQIPTNWQAANGTPVTGRPDMVICTTTDGLPIINMGDPTGAVLADTLKPLLGIEAKCVSSLWTSRKVLFQGKPKLDHLLQAAHYSWQLGIPFRLVYKQYTNQSLPDWAHKNFPKQGDPLARYLEYGDGGKPKHVKPFELVYVVEIDLNGRITYRREDSQEEAVTTPYTVESIRSYFEHVSKMGEKGGHLGSMPLTLTVSGEEDSYSNCDYCPLQTVCTSREWKSIPRWTEAVRKHLDNNGGRTNDGE